MKSIVLFFIFGLLKIVAAIETTREIEGYPLGFLTACPGVQKEAKISPRSLRRLTFYHLQKGSFLTANRTIYNYYQMKLLAPKMDFRKKTILFLNGYLDSPGWTFVSPAMGSIYTDKGYNVLLLDYMYFTTMLYPLAARVLPAVGFKVAEMLVQLSKYGLDPKKLEILGLSHGGQGVSFIAKSYRKITGTNITRITALDPSGPCFRRLGPEHRIDASDADLVDIIHTNSEGYGIAGAVGHVNFYINGGEYQVADIKELPCTNLCSHSRSFLIWVAAMENPDLFVGVQCDSIQDARDGNCLDGPRVTNVLGPKTDPTKQGIFYLATSHSYPYGLGAKGIDKKSLDNLYQGDIMALNKDVLVV